MEQSNISSLDERCPAVVHDEVLMYANFGLSLEWASQ